MLDHVSITVTNIGTAEKFYDATMSALSVPKVRKSEVRLGYGERCGTIQTELICRSSLVVSQMMRRRDIGVSRHPIARQWMHFRNQVWKTGERTTVLRAFAKSIMRLTMPLS